MVIQKLCKIKQGGKFIKSVLCHKPQKFNPNELIFSFRGNNGEIVNRKVSDFVLKKDKKAFTFGKVTSDVKIEVLPENYIINNKCRQIKIWKRTNVPAPNDALFPENYLTVNNMGQRVVKPHLYIDGLEVKAEFEGKGVGREVLNQIIEKSKQEGFEGRVMLSAMNLSNQVGIKPPPAGFYYICGFKPEEARFEKILQDIKNGLVSIWDAPNGISMYYPVA